MFIDTHAHLYDDVYENLDEIILKIKNAGCKRVIVSGCDMESNLKVLDLIKKYDIIYGTIGFHPTELKKYKDEDLEWLTEHISDDKIVGIGEIGLDYHYDDTNKEKEIYVFRKQLEIASKFNKPVIVHSRDAICDTYNILKEYKVSGTIHSFSGSLEMANLFIKLGFYIGVGGVVTFKNAKNIVNVVKNISLSHILLETDSPFLTPEPYRGKRNDPSYISLIASEIASIKDTSKEELFAVTSSNAEALFDFLIK